MKDLNIQASDLRDIACGINKAMHLRIEYPDVFASIETELYAAATALVNISAKCTKGQHKYIFGDDKR